MKIVLDLFNEQDGLFKDLDLTARLTKAEKQDVKDALEKYDTRKLMSYMMDQYLQSQKYRMRAQNQLRALDQKFDIAADTDHPLFIQRTMKNTGIQEKLNEAYLRVATDSIPLCRWMKSIVGVGHVTAAHLYAKLDVRKVSYATEFLSYCGLNDNNDPWLGAVKGKKIASDANKYREDIYNGIVEKLHGLLSEYGRYNQKVFYDTMAGVLKSDENKTFDPEVLQAGLTACRIDADPFKLCGDIQEAGISPTVLNNVILWKKNPKRADSVLYSYAANVTKRKYSRVENGTFDTWNRKSPRDRTSEIVIDDLAGYLAKPPYNKDLKTRCYLISNSFMYKKNQGSLYGRIYDERWNLETYKNHHGDYKDLAEEILATKNVKKEQRKVLEQGRLTDGHIMLRAKRYAVKLFISHVYEAMYYAEYHEDAPQHYVIAHMGHQDYIAPEVDFHPYL